MPRIKKTDGTFFTDAEVRALNFDDMTPEVADQIIAAVFNNPARPESQLDIPFVYIENKQINREMLSVLEKVVTLQRGVLDKPAYRILVAGLQYLQAINSEANIARARSVEARNEPELVNPFFALGQKKAPEAAVNGGQNSARQAA